MTMGELLEMGATYVSGMGEKVLETDWQIRGEDLIAFTPPEKKWIGWKWCPYPHPDFLRLPNPTESSDQ